MILVDGYNVLHTQGVLPPRLAGIEVPGLLRLIHRSRYAGRRLSIVCDGSGTTGRPGVEIVDGSNVHYSGPHSEADAVIERMLSTASAARTWLVVSSDRRVQRAARRARADALDSRTFLEQLVADESHKRKDGLPPFATEVPLDRYSVAHWLEEFGLDPSDALEGPLHLTPARALNPPVPSPSDAAVRRTQPHGSRSSASPSLKPIPSGIPLVADALLIRAAHEPGNRLVLSELDMTRWLPPPGTPIPDPGPRTIDHAHKNKLRSRRGKKSKG